MTKQPSCPECEKLAAVSEESNKIGEFLDWMSREKELILCQEFGTLKYSEIGPATQYMGSSGINRLLAEYYEIDLDKVEDERRALLEWIREMNT